MPRKKIRGLPALPRKPTNKGAHQFGDRRKEGRVRRDTPVTQEQISGDRQVTSPPASFLAQYPQATLPEWLVFKALADRGLKQGIDFVYPVSYTHLTLPTKA